MTCCAGDGLDEDVDSSIYVDRTRQSLHDEGQAEK